MKGYVLDYINENEFKKLERALKKYNMLAFKKLNFEYYPALRNGKFVDKKDLVYFGNLKHKSGSVVHCGDNLTGSGAGDDEQILVELKSVPSDVDRIVFVVNIYDCIARRQHFGMVKNAYIRIEDQGSRSELCRFNLTDEYNGCTAMIMGEVSKEGNEWQFHAIGQGTDDAKIGQLVNRFS